MRPRTSILIPVKATGRAKGRLAELLDRATSDRAVVLVPARLNPGAESEISLAGLAGIPEVVEGDDLAG